ncbi:MAG: tripartite tricarboxylate transporter TctB family protein [Alphaproteobacteria bacterium]|nr:tripartite tricarboxylate transporter TctB family protein [Alphaproteobacteria bacterium]
MKVLSRDTWIGVVMLIVAGVYWLEASKIRVSPLDDGIGAGGLPKALAYALGVLAIILIVRDVAGALLARQRAAPTEAARPLKETLKPHLRAAGMLALGVGYLLLVSTLGYAITIGLLLFCVSLYIGAKLNLRTVLVAAIGGVAYHLLFVEFLGIPLPAGAILGPLFGS